MQHQAWDCRTVVVTGVVQGGARRFQPTDAGLAREAPRFSFWPDNVVHVRTH
jgi:hypothetical protein